MTRGLSFCADGEIIGQLVFVLLMFFEDLPRARRHVERNSRKTCHLNAIASVGRP